MRSGQLRYSCVVKSATVTDGGGWKDRLWTTTFATVWGGWVSGRKLESLRNSQIIAITDKVLRIRFYPGITSQMRISVESIDYEIGGIEDVEGLHNELLLTVRSVSQS